MVAEKKEDFIRMATEAGEVLFCGMTDWKQVSGWHLPENRKTSPGYVAYGFVSLT